MADKYEQFAKTLLDMERRMKPMMKPIPTGVIVRWRARSYIGAIQTLRPDGIVLLAKPSVTALAPECVKAIQRLDPDRKLVMADSQLDLDGRQHVCAYDAKQRRLMVMSPDQTKWAMEAGLNIKELGLGEKP